MNKSSQLIDTLKAVLENTVVSDEDFEGPAGGAGGKEAHKKIVNAIKLWWLKTHPFVEGNTLGLDFLGRVSAGGEILLAVEVDTTKQPMLSWMKLADIRADNKIWIYLPKPKSKKPNDEFKLAVKIYGSYLKDRFKGSKVKKICGQFIAFLKTPKIFKMKKIYF